MRKVMPGWHGADVVSFPKVIKLQYQQSAYAVTSILYNAVSSSVVPVAIAIPDTQLLQKTLSSLSSLDEYQANYAFDFRSVNKHIIMTALKKNALQSMLDKHPFLQVKIVDTESSSIQRCLQKLFLIDSVSYVILLIDQVECRFYVLHQGSLLFKYREPLSNDITISIQRCWKLFTSKLANFPCQHLYVAGDHDHLFACLEMIQQIVSFSVQLINPFDHLTFVAPLNKQDWYGRGPSFAVACGLALRGMVE